MNWLYLIPVAALLGLFLMDPLNVVAAVVIVGGGAVLALWLTDKMGGN